MEGRFATAAFILASCIAGAASAATLPVASDDDILALTPGEAVDDVLESVPLSNAFIVELAMLVVLWVVVGIYGCMQAKIGSQLQTRTVANKPAVQAEMVQGVAHGGAQRQTSGGEGAAARRGEEAHGSRVRSAESAAGSFLSQTSKSASQVFKIAQELGIATPGSNTFYGSIFNLLNCGLGAGILTLPWATAGASLSTAVLIVGIVLWANAFTIKLLVEAADERKIFDIGGLLGELPGSLASSLQVLCNAVIWIVMFLALVCYYIVISDCIQKASFALGLASEGSSEGLRSAALVGAAIVLVPLCFLDQDKLAYTSTLTVIVNIYVFVIIGTDVAEQFSLGAGRGAWKADAPICLFGFGYGSIAMFAMMARAICIQMVVLPMYGELKDPSPQKFKYIVNASFAGLFLLFSGFAVAGVLAYGERTASDNVLNNLGTSTFDAVGQAGMVLCIMSVYPFVLLPMVAPVKYSNSHRHWASPITLCLVVVSCALAFPIKGLGKVSLFAGALCVAVFVGIIPGLVGYFLLHKNVVAMGSLTLVSIAMGALGLVFNNNIYDGDTCFLKAW